MTSWGWKFQNVKLMIWWNPHWDGLDEVHGVARAPHVLQVLNEDVWRPQLDETQYEIRKKECSPSQHRWGWGWGSGPWRPPRATAASSASTSCRTWGEHFSVSKVFFLPEQVDWHVLCEVLGHLSQIHQVPDVYWSLEFIIRLTKKLNRSTTPSSTRNLSIC